MNEENKEEKFKFYTTEELERMEEDAKENPKKEKSSFHKKHFGFELRIFVFSLLILSLFGTSFYYLWKAISMANIQKVTYDEIGRVGFRICEKEAEDCLGENIQYDSGKIGSVIANFTYFVKLDASISYEFDYYITSTMKFYHPKNRDSVLYSQEALLVEKTNVSDTRAYMNIDKTVEVDYESYERRIEEYNEKNEGEYEGEMDITLHIEQENGTKEVTLIVPLRDSSLQVNKIELENRNKKWDFQMNAWNEQNILYGIISVILLLSALLLLFELTKFVLSTMAKQSPYQKKLNEILEEYDRIIVIARDGYQTNTEKSLVKMNSFEELLNVHLLLKKPIIYTKINKIKCDFIVEDSTTIYRYVMKEVDFEEQKKK